jgi:hypothetical protein
MPVMKDTGCPIVDRCLEYLRAAADLRLMATVGAVHELLYRYDSIPSSPYHTQLRGFIAIEEMVRATNYYIRAQGRNELLCSCARSWAGLTQQLDQLNELRGSLELERTELELQGAPRTLELSLPLSSTREQTEARFRLFREYRVTTHLLTVYGGIENAVRVLRPYLRNYLVSVSSVGVDLTQVFHEVYGEKAINEILQTTNIMMSVQL